MSHIEIHVRQYRQGKIEASTQPIPHSDEWQIDQRK
jgi:hypothetical protein